MRDDLLLALLPGGKESLSGFVRKINSPVFLSSKITFGDRAQIDERQNEAIRKWRAQLLKQIERERRAARAQRMQKSYGRVEPHGFQRAGDLQTQDAVCKGKQSIHWIQRRAAISALCWRSRSFSSSMRFWRAASISAYLPRSIRAQISSWMAMKMALKAM